LDISRGEWKREAALAVPALSLLMSLAPSASVGDVRQALSFPRIFQ
jgi:hypothetical protein